ncbi:hypothetical protein [Thiobacillus sp.]
MSNDKTLYSIRNENGEVTTITLDKLVAGALQESLPDVRAWVQNSYDRVAAMQPELSRHQKGDLVRRLSIREAEKSPRYIELIVDNF